MKTATLTALLTLAALAPGAASATEPLVTLSLSQGRTALPLFILEGESRSRTEFEGSVLWTVNGVSAEESAAHAFDGQFLDLRILPLDEASIVCADLRGWLGAGADGGLEVSARSCVLWLPSEGPLASVDPDSRLQEEQPRPVLRPVDARRLR